ncbi:hypothetical protein B0H19DRAFT_1224894 [Mycena capillaripes]|nr:hypothetical protein B0H19DRAFT_1224894 [Mycena capillaripes]
MSCPSLLRLSSLPFCIFSFALHRHYDLTASQSARLIETLSDDKTSSKPHPATLIRDLGLTDGVDAQAFKETKSLIKALKNLESTSLGLRVLHWSLAAGVDELGKILGAPGKFPQLKELFVSCDGSNNNFNVSLSITIHASRPLNIHHNTYYSGYNDTGSKLCYKLAEAMQMLSSSSPRLHILRFKLKIPWDYEAFPNSSYSDLIAAVNGNYLPFLATLDLSANLVPDEIYDYGGSSLSFLPDTDFSPFLASHPNLTDLTLSALGTKFREDVAYLPRLRSFQGSFQTAIAICARQRQLTKLVLTPADDVAEWLPTFNVVPLPENLSLTKLHLLALDTLGSPMKIWDDVCPKSFAKLVTSFPNLTHLDICINKRMSKYRQDLICLMNLKSLRLQQYSIRRVGPPSWPARLLFPHTDYMREIDLLLPSLSQLTDIEICVLADTVPASDYPDSDSDSDSDSVFDEVAYERAADAKESPPEMRVDYFFSVIRPASGAYVVLDNAQVVDSYSWYSERTNGSLASNC